MTFGEALGDLLRDAYVRRAKVAQEIEELWAALDGWTRIEAILEKVRAMEQEESWEYAE